MRPYELMCRWSCKQICRLVAGCGKVKLNPLFTDSESMDGQIYHGLQLCTLKMLVQNWFDFLYTMNEALLLLLCLH